MDLASLGAELREEAERADHRRLVVLAGDRDRGYAAVQKLLEGASISREATTLVGSSDRLDCESVGPRRASELLGTTRDAIVIDGHHEFRPNALGQIVGAVDGGGLLALLLPPLEKWPGRRDEFDRTLAVPPFDLDDVTGRFRERVVRTIRRHPGVAVVNLDEEEVYDDGLIDPAPRLEGAVDPALGQIDEAVPDPAERSFPAEAYRRCLTRDQIDALAALERLRELGVAVVIEADRGRGKSSAAGLAAGALAADGEDVLVTAPEFRSAAEGFARAQELLDGLGLQVESGNGDPPRQLSAPDGGQVRFALPAEAVENSDADVLLVDEAAALPVSMLAAALSFDRVAFATTIHGYEGAGRGFSVRFRDRLAESTHEVLEVRLDDPIRYAAGDPVEAWAFDTLLLDARPAVDQLVEDVDPEETCYRRLDATDLLADDHLLREAFGLLVLAHYRTEPDDLARLLDAPNLAARALVRNDRIVAIALLAREGGLPAERRAAMYDGSRVRGNMLPDVLTSQLRDEDAARPIGLRVIRIATHPAVRSRGLGSRLLSQVRTEAREGLPEFEDAPRPADDSRTDVEGVDWLGTGFGATPELLRFWRTNGYRTVHLATTRNERSGEYSALLLDPITDAGSELSERTTRRFVRRIPAVLADALDDADPDVIRATLRAVDAEGAPEPELTDWEWEVVAGAAYGPGLFDVAPGPFARLVVRYFADHPEPASAPLSDREERLLVRRALQAHDWQSVRDELDYHSSGQCMRALGDAVVPLADHYGGAGVRRIATRYDDD